MLYWVQAMKAQITYRMYNMFKAPVLKHKYFLLSLMFLMATSCANRVEVPKNVDVAVAPVSGEIIVKHVISIELPAVFTDSCRQQFPDDPVGYNACVAAYIQDIIKIIGSINP